MRLRFKDGLTHPVALPRSQMILCYLRLSPTIERTRGLRRLPRPKNSFQQQQGLSLILSDEFKDQERTKARPASLAAACHTDA